MKIIIKNYEELFIKMKVTILDKFCLSNHIIHIDHLSSIRREFDTNIKIYKKLQI